MAKLFDIAIRRVSFSVWLQCNVHLWRMCRSGSTSFSPLLIAVGEILVWLWNTLPVIRHSRKETDGYLTKLRQHCRSRSIKRSQLATSL